MIRLSSIWFEILSQLFVDFAAAWFGVAFIEPQISNISAERYFLGLIFKVVLGIMSLVIAKYLREEAKNYD